MDVSMRRTDRYGSLFDTRRDYHFLKILNLIS